MGLLEFGVVAHTSFLIVEFGFQYSGAHVASDIVDVTVTGGAELSDKTQTRILLGSSVQQDEVHESSWFNCGT